MIICSDKILRHRNRMKNGVPILLICIWRMEQNCEKKHITQSMSKAGCPYDNPPMESFYGTFKAEFIRQNGFETDIELNKRTLDYVYGYYNTIRPHSSNGYVTLAAFAKCLLRRRLAHCSRESTFGENGE